MCIRPKGRTQCIFPRSQHSCLYVYIYIDQKWIYIKLLLASSRFEHCSNRSRNFFCKRFLKNGPPVAILDVQISLCIAFLTISDQHHNFYFCDLFYKMAAGGHIGCPKFTLDHISGQIFLEFFWQNGCRRPFLDVRKSLSISFLSISHFWQNGWRRPFWMSEFHFRSHFWPFQIDRPFWISEIHFLSQFWPFQIDTEFFFRGHFWCLKSTLDRISSHFRLIGHFGCPKFTSDGISGHFKSIQNFYFF